MTTMCTWIFRVTDAEGHELGTVDAFAYKDDPVGAESDAQREARKKWGDDQSYTLEVTRGSRWNGDLTVGTYRPGFRLASA